MLTALCFLWFDPQGRHNDLFVYDADCVNRLRRMLARHLTLPHELVCCTDIPDGIDPGVRIVPLPAEAKGLAGLRPKLYAFHPDAARLFGRRILMLDLDVVVCGSLDGLVGRSEPFLAWEGPPNNRCRYNTSFVLMDGGAFPDVWTRWDPETSPAELAAAGYRDAFDQDWIAHIVGDRGATVPRSGAGIESFTPNRFRPLPDVAALVAFNGRASPAMASCRRVAPWIVEHWR